MYGAGHWSALYSSSVLEALQDHKAIEMVLLLGFFSATGFTQHLNSPQRYCFIVFTYHSS